MSVFAKAWNGDEKLSGVTLGFFMVPLVVAYFISRFILLGAPANTEAALYTYMAWFLAVAAYFTYVLTCIWRCSKNPENNNLGINGDYIKPLVIMATLPTIVIPIFYAALMFSTIDEHRKQEYLAKQEALIQQEAEQKAQKRRAEEEALRKKLDAARLKNVEEQRRNSEIQQKSQQSMQKYYRAKREREIKWKSGY